MQILIIDQVFYQSVWLKRDCGTNCRKNIYQLKEDFRQTFREQKLAQSMRNKIVEDVRITPNEVKKYYENIPKDSLHFYESELEIGQIVIYPKASRELEDYAIDQLKEYKQQVESGQKILKRLHLYIPMIPEVRKPVANMKSTGMKNNGIPYFLQKLLALKDGQVSNVFKTRFGYHIIQMVSRAGDDAVDKAYLKNPPGNFN